MKHLAMDSRTDGSARVDRALASLRLASSMPTAEGLEGRVLARLQASSRAAQEAPATTRGMFRSAWKPGWAPAAMAASLVCVFTGGMLVAREQRAGTDLRHTILIVAAAEAPGTLSLPLPARDATLQAESRGPLTAAARRKPTLPVPAGKRRGRGFEGVKLHPR